jgi:prepilin-type N-terminal cleavage/methylation domain-containing protein
MEMIKPLSFVSKRNQKGFTLIELIAVLVILGITLAVAVPNYMNIISDAGNAAAMQAVAEGKARLNHKYALMFLNQDPHAQELDAIVEGVSTDAGDYELNFTVSTNPKEVEVKARGIRTGVSGQASGKWSISKDES